MMLRYIFAAFTAAILMTGCDSELEPADASTPRTTVYLLFGRDIYNSGIHDGAEDRHNPCRYFDGAMNRAFQVDVRIGVPDPASIYGFKEICPPQIFLNGRDFSSGDPNGIGAQMPAEKGFLMTITIYGEPDPRCCPGPPVGRVVYREFWTYSELGDAMRVRSMLPETTQPYIECAYF